MNLTSRRWTVGLIAALAAGVALAQGRGPDLQPGQWQLEAMQSRFSALIDGRLLDDEKSVIPHTSDGLDSWARSEWRASWRPEQSPLDLQWATFIDAQVHVNGVGGGALRRINNSQDSGPGGRHVFEIESVKYRRVGLAVSRGFDFPPARLIPNRVALGASLYAVDQFKSASARGVLEGGRGAQLALQATALERELGKRSSFVRPENALGWGLGLDLSALWGSPDGDYLRFAVLDVGPAVSLQRVLVTERSIDTDTVRYDENGYVELYPAINGQYRDSKATLRIKPELRVEAGWQQRAGQRWLGSLVKHGARKELAVLYQHTLGAYRLDVGAHALAKMPASLSVGVAGSGWGVGWRGDSLRPGKARIWGLSGHVAF